MTTVGSGGPGSQSFYGAADMGGNVWEWNEQVISTNRGLRGGSFVDAFLYQQSSNRISVSSTLELRDTGFRIARP